MAGPRSLSRRRLLRLGGATLGSGLTGCSAPLTSSSGKQGASRCGPESLGGHTVTCANELEAPRTLTVSPTKPSLPATTIEATFTNTTETSVTGDRYDFSVFKRAFGDWHLIAPWSVPLGASSQTLAPGESLTWTLNVDVATLGAPCPENDDAGVDLRLGPGGYAIVYDGGLGDETAQVVGRRVPLSGDALAAVPTTYVSDVRRDGTTVSVTSKRPSWCQEGNKRRATLVVSRSQTPRSELQPKNRLLLEHLYSCAGRAPKFTVPLRNALAYFEDDVETVRVTTDGSYDRPFGFDGTRTVAVGADTYQLATELRGHTSCPGN